MVVRKKPAAKGAAKGKAEQVEPNPLAVIGANNPPEAIDDPVFDQLKTEIDDLYEQAQQWLDDEPITNESMAEKVTMLRGMIKDAAKRAEDERAKQKKPHWDAGLAVDAKWKPVKALAEKAEKAAGAKLTQWLQLVAAEQRRIAEEARQEALRKEEQLREAHQKQQQTGNLMDADHSEELEKEVKQANREAKVAAKQTSTIVTDYGRARLRTVWHVEVVDRKALLQHYMTTDPDWLTAVLFEKAQSEVRGVMKKRFLPGCNITSTQEV